MTSLLQFLCPLCLCFVVSAGAERVNNLSPLYSELQIACILSRPPSSSLYPLHIHSLTHKRPLSLTPAAVLSLRVVSARSLPALQGGGGVLFARRPFTSRGLGLGNSWASCERLTQGPLLSLRWESEALQFVIEPGFAQCYAADGNVVEAMIF